MNEIKEPEFQYIFNERLSPHRVKTSEGYEYYFYYRDINNSYSIPIKIETVAATVKEAGLITSNVILERTPIEFNSDFHIKLVIYAEDLSLDHDNKDYFPELSILTKDKSGTSKRSKGKAKVKFSNASPVG